MQCHDMKTNHFWYQSTQRWKINLWLGLNNIPAKTNHIQDAALCSCPSHRILKNKHCNNTQCGHMHDITLHLFISFSFDPYCMTELFPTCPPPPLHEQATHQRHIQQILCVIEQLCSTQQCSGSNSQHIQYSLCMCVNVNVNAMNWYRWCSGERSSSYVSNPGSILQPLSSLHYLLFLSF